MKLAVVGAGGLLGWELCRACADVPHQVAAADRGALDVTDAEAVRRFVAAARPDVVVNAAAFTDVDACESQPDRAFAVNAEGARHVAAAAAEAGARLIHVSTDYVFGGARTTPYLEDDVPTPCNVYGASKLRGEALAREACPRALVVRTAGLYGARGRNFVKTMLDLARRADPIRVVDDQTTSPTWARDLARQMLAMLDLADYGVYHASARGGCTWCRFAREIFRQAGIDREVLPVTSEQFPRPARRPPYSVLDNARLRAHGRDRMPPWEDELRNFLGEWPA